MNKLLITFCNGFDAGFSIGKKWLVYGSIMVVLWFREGFSKVLTVFLHGCTMVLIWC